MASNSQKDLNKLGKEMFTVLSNFPSPRKGKASPWPRLVLVQNGSGKNEECIDSNQAPGLYGGYVFTACPPQIKTVKRPIPKASVHSVYQHYYQRTECCCSS